jgi:hypothetical protein
MSYFRSFANCEQLYFAHGLSPYLPGSLKAKAQRKPELEKTRGLSPGSAISHEEIMRFTGIPEDRRENPIISLCGLYGSL